MLLYFNRNLFVYVALDKLALLVVFSLFERYVYTRGSETKGPSKTLCSWSDLSYRGTKVLQVNNNIIKTLIPNFLCDSFSDYCYYI